MAYGDIDLTPELAAWLVHHRVLKEEHLTQPVKGKTTVCVFDKAAQDLLFEGCRAVLPTACVCTRTERRCSRV